MSSTWGPDATGDFPCNPNDAIALPLPDVARRLRVAVRTVQRCIARGELKVIKVGSSTRVIAQSLREFIAKGGTPR